MAHCTIFGSDDNYCSYKRGDLLLYIATFSFYSVSGRIVICIVLWFTQLESRKS